MAYGVEPGLLPASYRIRQEAFFMVNHCPKTQEPELEALQDVAKEQEQVASQDNIDGNVRKDGDMVQVEHETDNGQHD